MDNVSKNKNIFSNYNDSHQSQPWSIVSFLNFDDPSQEVSNSDSMAVTNNTITSDVLSVNVATTKNGHISTAELTLVSGEINYQSILSPGDHVLIWMGDDMKDYESTLKAAKQSKKANTYNSGLKFMGKINSVRTMYSTGGDGTKTVRYMVTCKSFSEFDIQVYFNPLSRPAQGTRSDLAFNTDYLSRVSAQWQNRLFTSGLPYQMIDYIDFFINTFLGEGPAKSEKTAVLPGGKTSQRVANGAMLIPAELESMLGADIKGLKTYSKICNRYYGIQHFNTNKYEPTMTTYVRGSMAPPPDLFNNSNLWSSMQSLSNTPINEMYVTLRVDEDGDIFPAFTIRQLPFSTSKLKSKVENTQFASLPRWIIDSSRCIQSFNIGTSDAMRFNFIQVYGSNFGYQGTTPHESQQVQIADGNLIPYNTDITRHGPRTLIQNTLCEVTANGLNVSQYVALIADWYKDGQLKFTGSITTSGIKEPICIGDNLQIDDKIFHIESVMHSYSVTDNGIKSFSTNMTLSHGVTVYNDSTEYLSNDLQIEPDADNSFTPGSSSEGNDKLDFNNQFQEKKSSNKKNSDPTSSFGHKVRKRDTSGE